MLHVLTGFETCALPDQAQDCLQQSQYLVVIPLVASPSLSIPGATSNAENHNFGRSEVMVMILAKIRNEDVDVDVVNEVLRIIQT